MKQYIKHDEWKIIEEGFDPQTNEISESIFSIGNGYMGQRANFEEGYSGDTLPGSYLAGIYYPDKTRVGWWKNGYPEYFAKVLNAPNWIGISLTIEGQRFDLATCEIRHFRRVLDMKTGLLTREVEVTIPTGKQVRIESTRFCSMARKEIGAIRYSITPLNFSGAVQLSVYVDGDVVNKDSNYDEKFWEEVYQKSDAAGAVVTTVTRKTNFHVCTRMTYSLTQDNRPVHVEATMETRTKFAGHQFTVPVQQGKTLHLHKYVAIVSSLNFAADELLHKSEELLRSAVQAGFDTLREEHAQVWDKKWSEADITIEGDIAAQQGIRFNIFQLVQTYTGEDERLNIGPKGFTGEKYGGSTYWDTEAYCLPFFLSTAEQRVSRNLLVYRFKHLARAIENASKLGFTNGAALYPMVTMNGEECHNEWEITFEEIHRNGAIAYAIFDYIRYTEDKHYLLEYGMEVLIGISRFWAQRVNWSEDKQKYVMLGVTGPNEYENNVNNNWYTNYLATWTLTYTMECLKWSKEADRTQYQRIIQHTHLAEVEEMARWGYIVDNMYFPEDTRRGIYLQQDGFLDKELRSVDTLRPEDRPLNQRWSWDRILRSCFIKQADVLQGLYFFEDQFTLETIRRNFDFYEPMTVHESSLSPCVHVILASRLGYKQKAYELYLRTARLDLDNYNNDTEDGCHITSMAGTWMSVVKGFGGMKISDGMLRFDPFIPDQWASYSFTIEFRGRVLTLRISKEEVHATLKEGEPLDILISGHLVHLAAGTTVHDLSLTN